MGRCDYIKRYSVEKYPVKSIDVSSYQGEIDWEKLSSEEISFVFIKATEESPLVDNRFSYNFEEAQKTDLAVSVYYFFSERLKGYNGNEKYIDMNVFVGSAQEFQKYLNSHIHSEEGRDYNGVNIKRESKVYRRFVELLETEE